MNFIDPNKTMEENKSRYTRKTEASIPFVKASLPNTCQTEDAVTASKSSK